MMHIPKNYYHDRLILLLLSANTFFAILSSLLVLLKLDTGRTESYIIQYHSNLGLRAFRSGTASAIASFAVFSIVILLINTYLSIKVYSIKRHYTLMILGMSLILLILDLIVSNALLTQ